MVSYCLCDLIYKEYKEVSGKLVNPIQCRLSPEEIDKVDNANDELTRLLTKYEGEMYLSQLFFTLKEELMIKEEKISNYIGSRQQCLYGCICFVSLFFSVYDSINLIRLKNFDWFQRTVMNGGRSLISLPPDVS